MSDVAHELQAAETGGKPLPERMRNSFESRLGYDFSGVRIHDSPTASRLAGRLHATAFTHGEHIFFRDGTYRPHTRNGQRLLAHELTHVVQQGATAPRVQRVALPGWVEGGLDALGGPGFALGRRVIGLGGGVGSSLVTDPRMVLECARESGASVRRLVTRDFDSLGELLGLESPSGYGQRTIDAVTNALGHPCLLMLPGYGAVARAVDLEELSAFLVGAWDLMQNPGMILTPLKEAIRDRLETVPEKTRSAIEGAKGFSSDLASHFAGFWPHVEERLSYMWENWWDVVKESLWEMVWPWEGAWGDVREIWDHILTGATELWDLRLHAAADELIAAWRSTNALLGRFYGWFFLASVLVGAAVGAVFGGVGAIPGAAAGAAVAVKVGYGLLISALGAEVSNILKGIADISAAEDYDDLQEAYGTIADSGLAVGMIGALAVGGAVAARFARAMVARFPKAKVRVRDFLTGQKTSMLRLSKEVGDFFHRIHQGKRGGDREVTFTIRVRDRNPGRAPIEDVPGIGRRLGERLRNRGVETVDDLVTMSIDDLIAIPQIGQKTASQILRAARTHRPKISYRRRVDLQKGNLITEVKSSVNNGVRRLDTRTREQIRKDALIRDMRINDVDRVVWAFYETRPTDALRRALQDAGIEIRIEKLPIEGVGFGAAGSDVVERIPADD